jgi:hypothetical protein
MDRKREIEAAVAEVRAIEKREGVTRQSLEKIKQRLIRPGAAGAVPGVRFPAAGARRQAQVRASTAWPRTRTTASRST